MLISAIKYNMMWRIVVCYRVLQDILLLGIISKREINWNELDGYVGIGEGYQHER